MPLSSLRGNFLAGPRSRSLFEGVANLDGGRGIEQFLLGRPLGGLVDGGQATGDGGQEERDVFIQVIGRERLRRLLIFGEALGVGDRGLGPVERGGGQRFGTGA